MRKISAVVLCLYSLTFWGLMSPLPARAQLVEWTEGTCAIGGVATIQGFECLMQNILAIAVTLIGMAILIMFAIGSYKLITSGGDPKAVDAGKQTITYAVGGLIVALSAWFIINTIASVTGAVSIKTFRTQINDGTQTN